MKLFELRKMTPLYVSRHVRNAPDLVAWAKKQGFKTAIVPADWHVTVVFSRSPIDWAAAGDSFDHLRIRSGLRSVEPLGDKGAVVLYFESRELEKRWDDFIAIGASWDFPEYRPHLTITYKAPPDLNLEDVVPYDGIIELGPERFEELNPDWYVTVKEV